ncbi:MAG: hypothetical protein WCW02_04125 [Candidatus Buchananbacteria bacterium]
MNNEKDIISPTFFEGLLAYKKSGHSLTYINGYYSCALRQKGKCKDNREQSFKAKELDLKFANLLDKWQIDEKTMENEILPEIRKVSNKVKEEGLKVIRKKQENMQITIDAMKKDIKNKKKISSHDLAYIKTLFMDMMRSYFPCCLMAHAGVGLISLHDKDKSGFTTMFKRVYISDTGRFEYIELEGLGEAVLNFLETKMPGFTKRLGIPVRGFGLKNTNLSEAMIFFKDNNFRNGLSYSIYRSKHSEDRYFELIFRLSKNGNPKQIILLCEQLLYFHWQRAGAYFRNFVLVTDNNFDRIKVGKNKKISIK